MSECIFTYGKEREKKTAPVLRIIRGLEGCVQQAKAIKCVVDLGKGSGKEGEK